MKYVEFGFLASMKSPGLTAIEEGPQHACSILHCSGGAV